jgi:hypothetical protein
VARGLVCANPTITSAGGPTLIGPTAAISSRQQQRAGQPNRTRAVRPHHLGEPPQLLAARRICRGTPTYFNIEALPAGPGLRQARVPGLVPGLARLRLASSPACVSSALASQPGLLAGACTRRLPLVPGAASRPALPPPAQGRPPPAQACTSSAGRASYAPAPPQTAAAPPAHASVPPAGCLLLAPPTPARTLLRGSGLPAALPPAHSLSSSLAGGQLLADPAAASTLRPPPRHWRREQQGVGECWRPPDRRAAARRPDNGGRQCAARHVHRQCTITAASALLAAALQLGGRPGSPAAPGGQGGSSSWSSLSTWPSGQLGHVYNMFDELLPCNSVLHCHHQRRLVSVLASVRDS